MVSILKQIKLLKRSYEYIGRDIKNIFRYGFSAPKFAERIWVDSQSISKALIGSITDLSRQKVSGRKDSAKVVDFSLSANKVTPINEVKKIRFCIEHWVNGKTWENTGVYEYMREVVRERGGYADKCKTIDDIVKRYKRLDLIFEQVKREGRLRTMKELRLGNFREQGGVLLHIGPDGELFFGGGGAHRFAIAYILKVPLPAQIGVVHVSAIDHLSKIRKGLN
jgi:hypothetical protein